MVSQDMAFSFAFKMHNNCFNLWKVGRDSRHIHEMSIAGYKIARFSAAAA